MPYSIPLRVVFSDRRREADVEPPRPHAERERRDEVAELVDEDEHAEPDDGERRSSCAAAALCAASAPRLGVGRDEVVEVAAGAPSTRASVSATVAAMSRNPIRPVEERRHRDLVRGVVGARGGPAALARLACERQQRERLEVGRLERERQPGEVELRRRASRRAPG